jgi:hypothetical protein
MTRPFNDDVNRGPDPLRDWQNAKEYEEFKNRTIPTLPNLPPALYPWWLSPETPSTVPDPAPGSYPYWIMPPAPPIVPSPAPGTRYPLNFGPAGINLAAPTAGGLMPQSETQPDGGFESNPQSESQQVPSERRLGRRTYRP